MRNTSKIPKVDDIWLATVPFDTPGNMEKTRPVIIVEVFSNSVKCIKLTSKRKNINTRMSCSKLKRPTFKTDSSYIIDEYKLIRYIGRSGL